MNKRKITVHFFARRLYTAWQACQPETVCIKQSDMMAWGPAESSWLLIIMWVCVCVWWCKETCSACVHFSLCSSLSICVSLSLGVCLLVCLYVFVSIRLSGRWDVYVYQCPCACLCQCVHVWLTAHVKVTIKANRDKVATQTSVANLVIPQKSSWTLTPLRSLPLSMFVTRTDSSNPEVHTATTLQDGLRGRREALVGIKRDFSRANESWWKGEDDWSETLHRWTV